MEIGRATILALLGGALAWASVPFVIRYADSRGLIDRPGARSSHTNPTPRGGGLAILAGVCAAWVVGPLLGEGPVGGVTGALCAALIVAGVGFVDDHHDLSAWVRLAAHLVAAVVAVALLAADAPRTIPTLITAAVSVVILVSMTNLFNFMDGADGYLSGQAMLFCAAGVGVAAAVENAATAALLLFLGVSLLGFFYWNRPPARIFMGDVGSGFVGFLWGAAICALWWKEGLWPFWGLTVCGWFVLDGAATLLRRMLRGEAWYKAHRCHAYQRVIQGGWDHARTTTAAMLLSGWMSLMGLAMVAGPGRAGVFGATAWIVAALAYAAVEFRYPDALEKAYPLT